MSDDSLPPSNVNCFTRAHQSTTASVVDTPTRVAGQPQGEHHDAPPFSTSQITTELLVSLAGLRCFSESHRHTTTLRRAVRGTVAALRQSRAGSGFTPAATSRRPLMFKGCWDGRSVRVLLDSGAAGNFVHPTLATNIDAEAARPCTVANGEVVSSLGTMRGCVHMGGGCSHEGVFNVLPAMSFDVILGMDFLEDEEPQVQWRQRAMRCGGVQVQAEAAVDQPWSASVVTDVPLLSAKQFRKHVRRGGEAFCVRLEEVSEPVEAPDVASVAPVSAAEAQLRSDFHDVFRDRLPHGLPPKRTVDHAIHTAPDALPAYKQPYRVSYAESVELKKQLTQLVDSGAVRPSNSPHGAPVLFVKKKSGELRLCMDYRALNGQTTRDRYPLPLMDDLFDRLHGARHFSKIDLTSGHHNIRIKEGHQFKTAFNTRHGSCEWNVLPFGLCNAPGTFQRLMNDVFKPELDVYVVIYLDDLLIFSKSADDHSRHVRTVLERLRLHKLYANPAKCSFFRASVEYLGHVVSADGVQPDPEKLACIRDWPPPRTVRQVRSFMGLASCYRKHVPQFATLATPLTDLERATTRFVWGPVQQTAFDTLKTELCSARVLQPPQGDKPFVVDVDASESGVGAVLTQEDAHGTMRPVMFLSRRLTPAEEKYPTHEREMLAIVYAMKKWRPCLDTNEPFTVHTDHNPLKYLHTQRTLSKRQHRWLETVTSFNFTPTYKPGRLMVVPDALSRVLAGVGDDVGTAVTRHASSPALLKLVETLSQPDARHDRYVLAKEWLWLRGEHGLRRCIPEDSTLRTDILREHHDAPTSGHRGADKLLEHVQRKFMWRGMMADVRRYTRGCPLCQRNKPANTRQQGLLQPLPIPMRRWEVVTMDFMTGLPETSRGHNAIAVFVDKLTKRGHFEPLRMDEDGAGSAPAVAELHVRTVFKQHGMSSRMVSDRDPRFTSKFWREVFKLVGTRVSLSTTDHPQTDGQTERLNRVVAEMLRATVNHAQSNWDERLHLCEFAYNDSVHASTGFTPFFLDTGRHPLSPSIFDAELGGPPVTSDLPTAENVLRRWQSTVVQARDAMQRAQDRMCDTANKTRRSRVFQVGDEVMVSTKNVIPDVDRNRASRKFCPKFVGPFKVLEKVTDNACRIDFPPTIRVHKVINIGFLKLYHPPHPIQNNTQEALLPPVNVDGHDEYEVERVLARRTRGRGFQVLVKWKGYPAHDASWVNERTVRVNANQMVADFDNGDTA